MDWVRFVRKDQIKNGNGRAFRCLGEKIESMGAIRLRSRMIASVEGISYHEGKKPRKSEETMAESAPSSPVIESTLESFIGDVIERSAIVTVVVDFWATWCQPCRILGPMLEKLAVEGEGKFVLVKAETERMPEIAAGFGVQSIPAVFAVRGGKVIDSFVGVLPEPSLRTWIERILPGPAEILAMEARALESTDLAVSESKYRQALSLSPSDSSIQTGLGRVVLALDRFEEARSIVQTLERRGFLDPEGETLKAELTLRGQGLAIGDLESLREAWKLDPKDNPTQLQLAEGLAAAGNSEEALGLALELVERDRRQTGESARKLMIAIFQLLPADSELASDFRRRLSFAL